MESRLKPEEDSGQRCTLSLHRDNHCQTKVVGNSGRHSTNKSLPRLKNLLVSGRDLRAAFTRSARPQQTEIRFVLVLEILQPMVTFKETGSASRRLRSRQRMGLPDPNTKYSDLNYFAPKGGLADIWPPTPGQLHRGSLYMYTRSGVIEVLTASRLGGFFWTRTVR